jgi:hypothetical protein
MFTKLSFRSILRPVLVCLFILSFYQVLVIGRVIPPTDGISMVQENRIKAQRYAYTPKSDLKLVMVGSSLTANIKAKEVGNGVINIAMGGGASQTGLELLEKSQKNPSRLLVEINETISRKLDNEIIDSIYNPLLYWTRFYLPMFREEYQPVSILIDNLKNRSKPKEQLSKVEMDKKEIRFTNPELTEQSIKRLLSERNQPLSEEEKSQYTQKAELIKSQIKAIEKNGNTRVFLFDIPLEPKVFESPRDRDVRALMQQLFPPNTYQWLSFPPAREWRTNDGIHLIRSDAQDYALFLRQQLLDKGV